MLRKPNTIFHHFLLGLSAAQSFKWLLSERPLCRNDFPLVITQHFEMAFHSEWLRNNPKGPYGPIPPKGARGALGSPLDPFGSPCPLEFPWPPAPGPFGSLGGGGGVPGVPLGPRDRHLVETTQGRLESLVADRSQTERVSRSAGIRGA